MRRTGLVALAILLLSWACATNFVSSLLLQGLERKYPPTAVELVKPADAIVVLGGGTTIPAEAWLISPTKPGTSRYLYAARLFRAGKAPAIVVVGGPAAPNGAVGALSSEEIKRFLVDVGVPAARIVEVPDSANTAQNALFAKPILRAHSFRHVLLVTSAAHMPRALAIFRTMGIDVTPASSDAEAGALPFGGWPDVRPNARALRRTMRVVHEYVGLLAYPLQLQLWKQTTVNVPSAEDN